MAREIVPITPPAHRAGTRLIAVACLIQLALTPAILPAAQQGHSAPEGDVTTEPTALRLTLSAAVGMAIQHNRQILLVHLEVNDSEAQKRLAESHYYPILKNESAVLHISELEGVKLPAGSIGNGGTGPLPAKTLIIGQGAATSYTSGTELAQPLTQMFRIHAGVKAADADLSSARIQAEDAENGVALLVHKLYYDILIEQMRGVAAQDAIDAATVVEEEARHGADEGKLLADSELQTRTELLDKKQAALVSRLNADDLTLQLDDALGLAIGTRLMLDPDSAGTPIKLPAREEALAQLLAKNPAILSARQTVAKAKAGVAAARDEYIPDVTGLARYSYQSGLPFFTHNFGTFGAAFTYNLFDGGGREAKLQDARIKLTMAQTQLAQTENNVRIEVSAAYDKAEQLEQLLSVTTQAVEAREESLRIQTERAKVDAQLTSAVASAHASLTLARMNLLNSRLNLHLAEDDIQRRLGERPE